MWKLLELIGWALIGVLLMLGSGVVLLRTGLVPAANLAWVGPLMPLLLALLAVLRLRAAGVAIAPLIGFARMTWARDFRQGLVLGGVTLLIAVVSLRLMGTVLPLPPVQSLPWPMLVYLGTVGALIPGVSEELYYRGMMLRVGRGLPAFVIVGISAVAFSLWHIANPAYLPHTLAIGVVYALVVLRIGRLAPVIVAHTAANAGLVVLLLLGIDVLG